MAENEDVFTFIPPKKGMQRMNRHGGPAYGDDGGDIGDDGTFQHGTDAVSEDAARFRRMGENSAYRSAPQIDRTQSDESRGLGMESRGVQMGSLSHLEAGAGGYSNDMRHLGDAAAGQTDDQQLLRTAAYGAAPSRAEILGRQMSDRALRSQVSAAGNVRGGPGASAAAFRYGSQNAASQRADMNMGIQAERAAEMTAARHDYAGAAGSARRDYAGAAGAARSAYAGAATDLRGQDIGTRQQDIGLATSQAQVEDAQRARNDRREQFFENAASETKWRGFDADRAAFTGEISDRRADRSLRNAEEAQDWSKTKDVAAIGLGAASGGSAYAAGQHGGASQGSGSSSHGSGERLYGGRDDPYSDIRTKTAVQPVMMGSLGALQREAPRQEARQAKQRDEHREALYGGRDDPYGVDEDVSAIRYGSNADDDALDDRYTQGGRAPAPWLRETTTSDKKAKNADPDPFRPAPSTSDAVAAKQREGEAKSFKRDSKADQKKTSNDYWANLSKQADEQMAGMKKSLGKGPSVSLDGGEADEEPASWLTAEMNKRGERDVTISDPKAKKAAREEGIQIGLNNGYDLGKAGEAPPMGYKPAGSQKPAAMAPAAALARGANVDAYLSEPKPRSMQSFERGPGREGGHPDAAEGRGYAPRSHPDLAEGRERASAGAYEEAMRGQPGRLPGATPPPAAEPRQELALSDERAKNVDSTDAAMASAARSMEPSVYEYKPEYVAESGQVPGEKNVGPMANKMARDPVAGTAIVKDGESGMLAIDEDKGLKVVMGSLASLQHQIDALSKKRAA